MEDDSSNDVIAMEYDEAQESSNPTSSLAEKPIMQFFCRLLLNNVSQNTILTNAQLEDILLREYNFQLSKLHPLEVDIYVTVMKKHLKEWPLWDELDSASKDLTTKEYDNNFINHLEKRYQSLKDFLKEKLDMAKELSAEKVAEVKSQEMTKSQAGSSAEDFQDASPSKVVLEIMATRAQLNKLIYRQPHPNHQNTIFNVNDRPGPSHIIINTLSLEAILNWFSVKITISLQSNNIFVSRETSHELNHLLINRKVKNQQSSPLVTLNENLHINKDFKKVKSVSKKQIIGCLDLLSTDHDVAMEGMKTIIEYVKKDFEFFDKFVGAPASYKRYLSKHAYVRYLYTEIEGGKNVEKDKYDIQLRETISPMHQFFVGRMDVSLDKTLPRQWLKVECLACNITFTGETLATELKQHFDECHLDEPDWECTNCQKKLSMAYLAANWWSHSCQ